MEVDDNPIPQDTQMDLSTDKPISDGDLSLLADKFNVDNPEVANKSIMEQDLIQNVNKSLNENPEDKEDADKTIPENPEEEEDADEPTLELVDGDPKSVDKFLKAFRGKRTIFAIKEFNNFMKNCSDKKKFIQKLLEKTSCYEMLRPLGNKGVKYGRVKTIFEGLTYVLLYLNKENSDHMQVALKIANSLLLKHKERVFEMLKDTRQDRIKSGLACLHAMILAGGIVANKVLKFLSSWDRTFENLLKFRNPGDIRDVRGWFVHLVLTFVTLEDQQILEELLSNTVLLQKVINGLEFDSSRQVIDVIEVLHEFVLLNTNVTKKVKLQFFEANVVASLMNLYAWKRPEDKPILGKQPAVIEKQHSAEEIEEEAVEVRKTLLKFFVLLFTSNKYGIGARPGNDKRADVSGGDTIVFSTLSAVKRPWLKPQMRELMSQILALCPDLFINYVKSLENILLPRPSSAFILLMKMLIEVMKCQKPWQWAQAKEWRWAHSCLFPGSPLLPDFYHQLCKHEHRAVRHVGCTLMLTILRKVKETIERLGDLGLTPGMQSRYQRELLFKTTSTFPTKVVKQILENWKIVVTDLPGSGQTADRDVMKVNDLELPSGVELIGIVQFLCCYDELKLSSAVEEVLNPIDILNAGHIVNSLELDDLQSGSAVKKEFWLSCRSLLNKCIGDRRFNTNQKELEENVFFVLIRTFAQFYSTHKVSSHLFESVHDILDGFAQMFTSTLVREGISDEDESIKFWLCHISGSHSNKRTVFFTHVIQQTLDSYCQYTDLLIEVGENNANSFYSELLVSCNTVRFDNGWLHIPGFNKPFSRFVLAAIDLLTANPDPELIHYFSLVITDYIGSLYDPGLLIAFLLKKKAVMDASLLEYLGYFFKQPELPSSKRPKVIELDSDTDLSHMLKRIFMDRDGAQVKALLKSADLGKLIKGDLHIVILQLVLYLTIEVKKENAQGRSMVKNYAKLLEKLYQTLMEEDKPSAKRVIKTLLDNPRMLSTFSPLRFVDCPVTSLCLYLIEEVLEKHSEIISCVHPYYLRVLSWVKSVSLQPNATHLWAVVRPFVHSENTMLSYNDIEELLVIYVNIPCAMSPSHGRILNSLLTLMLRATTVKKQPQEITIHLLFEKYLEWTSAEIGENQKVQKDLVATVKNLLSVTMTKDIAQLISQADFQILLNNPSHLNMCNQLVQLYPQHGLKVGEMLKGYGGDVTSHAKLIILLLKFEDSKTVGQEVLAKLREPIKAWAMNLTDDDESHFQELFMHSLNAGILDAEFAIDVCVHIYKKVINDKMVPTKDMTSVLLLFTKYSEDDSFNSKIPLGDGNIALLHILLCVMKAAYKRDLTDTTMLFNCCNLLEDLLPKMKSEVRSSLTNQNQKLWPSFVKQVLRIGLNDLHAGSRMIFSLAAIIDVLYRDEDTDEFEKANALAISTIFKMIITHTQYLTLMGQRGAEWDKLKESVVALQQIIIDHEGSVCIEAHIPVLLGSYGASMSAADQRILKLIHTYETKGAMKRCEPVIWGDAAIAHFGTLSKMEMYRKPKSEQIISLLDREKVFHTCRSFDVNMPLEPKIIYGDDRTLYDMRFLIPLMQYLARDVNLLEIDFAESGVMAVGFTCLSSYQKEVWGVGSLLLKSVFEKMNKSRHIRFKLPWEWSIIIIGSSFNGESNRLPTLIVHYLLHVTRLLSNPQDTMYFPILRSMFVRPEFNLTRVPQLGRLFASGDVFDSRTHLQFLLNFLKTGIREREDYFMCKRTDNTHLMLMSLLQSPTADAEIRVQTLEVLTSMVHLPVAAQELVKKFNILTVLPMAITSLPSMSLDTNKKHFSYLSKTSVTSAVIKVLEAIWPSLFVLRKRTLVTDPFDYSTSFKRKRDDDVSSDEGFSDDNSIDNDRPSKRMRDDNKTVIPMDQNPLNVSQSQTRIMQEFSRKQLQPLVVEDFLSCLLHILPDVVDYAPPDYAARHINLISNTLKNILETSKLAEKETLRTISLGAGVVKEKIHSSIPWERVMESFKGILTDAEEVKLLGEKAEEYFQKWREEPLFQNNKNLEEPVQKMDDMHQLKAAIFNLMDLTKT